MRQVALTTRVLSVAVRVQVAEAARQAATSESSKSAELAELRSMDEAVQREAAEARIRCAHGMRGKLVAW
jgi:hypothetical protein